MQNNFFYEKILSKELIKILTNYLKRKVVFYHNENHWIRFEHNISNAPPDIINSFKKTYYSKERFISIEKQNDKTCIQTKLYTTWTVKCYA